MSGESLDELIKTVINNCIYFNKVYLNNEVNPNMFHPSFFENDTTAYNIKELFQKNQSISTTMFSIAGFDISKGLIRSRDNSSYIDINSSGILSGNGTNIMDINLMYAINSGNATVEGGTINDYMLGLYIWHSLLDKNIVENLPSTVSINIPDRDGSNMQVSISKPGDNYIVTVINPNGNIDISSTLETIISLSILPNIKANKIDRFILRRLLWLQIVLCNYRIAMSYYKANTGSSNAFNLLNAVYRLMVQANYIIQNPDGAAVVLNKKLDKRVKNYGKTLDYINEIDSIITDNKAGVEMTQQDFDKQTELVKKSNVLNYIALSAFLIISFGLVTILMINKEKHTKLIICAFLLASSIVILLVIYYQYRNRLKEYFGSPLSMYSLTADTTNFIYIEKIMMTEASSYIVNTEFIVNTLRTYKAYGNLNTSTTRELTFYRGINERLITAKTKIKNATSILMFKRKINQYTMAFYCILSIVFSLAVSIYLFFDESIKVRQILVVISGLIVVTLIIVFIMLRNDLVHTSPRNKYWSNVDKNKFD